MAKKHNIPGSYNYQIHENRTLYCNNNIVKTVDNKFTIKLYGYSKEVTLEWLYWYSFFKIDLPLEFRDRVFDIEFKDNGVNKVDLVKNPKVVVFKNPVEFTRDNITFRLIARFPDYGISEDGLVYRFSNNEFYKQRGRKNKKQYLVSTIKDQAELYTNHGQSTHRLVALAWIPNDNYVTKPIIDHIDNDKHNCNKDNIQWVSYKDNTKLAHEDELTTIQIPIYSRDIYTSEITRHVSISDCERDLGLPVNLVHNHYNTRDFVYTSDIGVYEVSTTKDDWVYTDKEKYDNLVTMYEFRGKRYSNRSDLLKGVLDLSDDPGYRATMIMFKQMFTDELKVRISSLNCSNKVYQIRHIETRETFVGSSEELSKIIDCSNKTFHNFLKLPTTHVSNDYQIRVYTNKPFDTKLRYLENIYQIRHIDTNEVHVGKAIDLCDIVGCSVTNLRRYANLDKVHVYNNYQIRHFSKKDWDKTYRYLKKSFQIKHIETNEVYVGTQQEMAKIIGCGGTTIHSHANLKDTHIKNNYQIRYFSTDPWDTEHRYLDKPYQIRHIDTGEVFDGTLKEIRKIVKCRDTVIRDYANLDKPHVYNNYQIRKYSKEPFDKIHRYLSKPI